MTDATWEQCLTLFEENAKALSSMPAAPPMPRARLCRESPHRTLGHLTSCELAWLPLLRQIHEGESSGTLVIRPNPLFSKLGFATMPWEELLERFLAGREMWRELLIKVDLQAELVFPMRTYTAQTLTKRLVDHEKHHRDQLVGP